MAVIGNEHGIRLPNFDAVNRRIFGIIKNAFISPLIRQGFIENKIPVILSIGKTDT